MRWPGWILALALGGCTAASPPARTATAHVVRVVSINPCIDSVLMRVADPAQIAGISHYSQDPRATSIPIEQAMRFRATSGTAEEVLALAPDLVIAGGHVEPSTIAALRRLHIALLQVGVPSSIAESDAQVLAVAAAIGHPERGVALVAETTRAIAAASADKALIAAASADRAAIPALIWQGGGLVPGKGTLADNLLRVSGFRNLSADYGLKKWDVLPLEYLVARQPRVLLSIGDAAHGDRMLGHPVMRELKDRIAVRDYPERLLHCGGPTIIDAVTRLAAIRRSL